jgi:Trk-type K+ transport system membrane component
VLEMLIGNTDAFADKNILESLSSILMKGISARGFGWDFIQQASDSTYFLRAAFTFFGAVPFATGGGATLLFFIFLYGIIRRKNQLSFQINVISKIVKIWMILFMIFLSVMFFITIIGNSGSSLADLFYLYTNHHLQISAGENALSVILKSMGMIAGRMSFIATCIIVINQKKHASGIF